MADSAQPPRVDELVHRVKGLLWILLIGAVILAIWGVVSRVRGRDEVGEDTARDAIPVVSVERPGHSPATDELVLPGDVSAYIEAPIYARTNGYLKAWYTDIGTPVKKGQLLAEIETPEVDQQLRQAKADLATALANARIAAITDVRWQGLLANHAVSPQDADTRAANAQATKAAADSARANVARLEDLEAFKRVVAPFDGVVTARNTDIGALINAGQSAGSQLFRIADTGRLRVYVQVPEQFAPQAGPGVAAQLHFNERPGIAYPAQVVRTARALDPNLRTLQVELLVDNANGELFPGSYTEVHFKLPGSRSTLLVPATALVFRAAGLQVATVVQDGRVKLRSIQQGRDFGKTVEVLSGLSPQEMVIVNPPDSIADNEQVRVSKAAPLRQEEARGKRPAAEPNRAEPSGQGQG
jgi:RND family efflux transporter MFP subunit